MNLEVTPEPTDAERAAIVAALVQETETKPQSWDENETGDCEEIVNP
jgi:hypothetical protein